MWNEMNLNPRYLNMFDKIGLLGAGVYWSQTYSYQASIGTWFDKRLQRFTTFWFTSNHTHKEPKIEKFNCFMLTECINMSYNLTLKVSPVHISYQPMEVDDNHRRTHLCSRPKRVVTETDNNSRQRNYLSIHQKSTRGRCGWLTDLQGQGDKQKILDWL